MNFLVTGGAGYIGSHFCQLAEAHGHSVTVIDNLSTGHEKFAKFGVFHLADLRKPEQYRALLCDNHFDVVFHFAGKALVRESTDFPEMYYDGNPGATLALLSVLKDTAIKKIVFSSSCATYGIHTELIEEHFPQNPINPYGQSKKHCEEILNDFQKRYDFEVAFLRYFNVIGQDPSGTLWEDHTPETHILPNILLAEKNQQSIPIFGKDLNTDDGTCVRDYMDVRDLVKVHLAAVDQLGGPSPFISNIGGGVGTSVLQLLQSYESCFDTTVEKEFRPAHPGDPAQLIASDRFFRSWYKEPLLTLEESILSLSSRR